MLRGFWSGAPLDVTLTVSAGRTCKSYSALLRVALAQPVGSWVPVGLCSKLPLIRAWVLVAVITNVIWLVSMIAGAAGWVYYWPVWPMLGMGIPVLITLLYGESQGRTQRQLEDERRRRERRDRRRIDP